SASAPMSSGSTPCARASATPASVAKPTSTRVRCPRPPTPRDTQEGQLGTSQLQLGDDPSDEHGAAPYEVTRSRHRATRDGAAQAGTRATPSAQTPNGGASGSGASSRCT